MQTVFMAVLSPWVGKLLTERSVRAVMLTGLGLLCLGLVVSSQATSLWHVYLGFGVAVSFGVILLTNLPCNLILANWFVRRRGTALGISQTGITVSGVLLVPLATYLIVQYGWRASFLMFAAVTPVVLGPLIWKLAIRSPEEVGLHPDGAAEPQPSALDPLAASVDWTFARAIRTRDVWLISLIAGPCFMAVAAVVIALPSHGTDIGLTAMQASVAVLVTTSFGALAKPLAGVLADHVSKRLVVALAIGMQVVAMLLLLVADTLLLLCAAGGLFGLGYGGIAPLWSLLLVERFGTASFAKIMGASMPLTMPFNLVGLPVATLVFELTGSYLPAFALMLGGYAIAAVCLWKLRLPAPAVGDTGDARAARSVAD